MHNKDKPWFEDQYSHALGLKRMTHLRRTGIALWLTGKSLSIVNKELMKPTGMPSVSLVSEIDVLMNAQYPHKWLSTLKSAIFGSNSSLPPIVGGGCGLVFESVG